jgi:predicted helicase
MINNSSPIEIEIESTGITTIDQLAQSLAIHTRFISDEIIMPALKQSKEYKPIIDFFHSVKKHLIHDLSHEEFADLYAQTLTFGLFTAVILAKGKRKFTRFDILKTIPKTNIVLQELFEYISGENIPYQLEFIVNRIISDLQQMKSPRRGEPINEKFFGGPAPRRGEPIKSDSNGVQCYQANSDTISAYRVPTQWAFSKKPPGSSQDPLIHFYETFLTYYNPRLREKRGVYYTPQPVVSFIVRSIHLLLQEKFFIAGGLADNNNIILDPAAGTSAFLWEAVNLAVAEFASRYGKGIADRFGYHLLLDRVYGFELLPAAYAVSHLKLNLLLKSFNARLNDDERLNIYLTNTLEMEDLEQMPLPGMDVLSVESRRAGAVKQNSPISIIMGNPPYSLSNSPANKTNAVKSRKKSWISELLDDYKQVSGKRLEEKNLKWLQEDYVRFIRFAQWKIDQNGKGIIGFITNHSYLDNPTFRGMRRSLMQSFDEIYILDLHGNVMKKEKTSDGSKDENIFDIRQGVAITLFVKTPEWKKNVKSTGCKVYFSEILGTREEKYNLLKENDVFTIDWKPVQPGWNFYLFNRVTIENEISVKSTAGISKPGIPTYKLTEIFPVYSTGIVTARDRLCIRQSADDVYRTVSEFSSLSEARVREVYNLPDDTRDWQVKLAQKDILESSENVVDLDKKKIVPILYRPFDIRYTYYTGKTRGFHCMPRPEVMRQMLHDNIGLISVRQVAEREFTHCFVGDTIIESRVTTSNKGLCYVFPLYFYPGLKKKKIKRLLPVKTVSENDNEKETRQFNIYPEFIDVLERDMKMPAGQNELAKQVFYYIYAVLYSPHFRKTQTYELKIDFPNIPFPLDYDLFNQLSQLGKRLTDIHLMKSKELNRTGSKFEVPGSNRVEKASYVSPRQLASQRAFKQVKKSEKSKEGIIYINKSQYFSQIKPEMWEYMLCGYQILRKWLNMRKNKTLRPDEISQLIRMVRCIQLTMDYQEKIDSLFKELMSHEGIYNAVQSTK